MTALLEQINQDALFRDAESDAVDAVDRFEERRDMMNNPEPLLAKNLKLIDDAFVRAQQAKDKSMVKQLSRLCEMFYKGEQWFYFDPDARDIKEDANLRKHGMVLNIIRSHVMLLATKALSQPIRLESVPAHRNSQARERAEAVTRLHDYWYSELELDHMDRQMAKWELVFGKVYQHVFWNPSKKAYLPYRVSDPEQPPVFETDSIEGVEYYGRIPYAGEWLDVYYGPFGDMDIEVRQLYSIYVEPGIVSLDQATRFFTASLRSLRWVSDTFGKEMAERLRAEVISDSRAVGGSGDLVEAAPSSRMIQDTDAIDAQEYSPDSGLVWVKEAWELSGGMWRRTCYVMSDKQNPDGVHLNPGESVWEHHGYFEYEFDTEPETFWSKGLVWDLLRIQRSINRLATDQQLSQTLSRKPILLTTGDAKLTKGTLFNTVTVPPSPSGFTHQWQTIPQTSGEAGNILQQQVDFIDRLSIVHDITRGEVKSRATGTAIERLINEQQVVPDELARSITRVNVRRAEAMLSLARAYYDEPRLIHILGSDYKPTLITSQALPAVSRIQSTPGAFLPRSKMARLDAAGSLAQLGLFDPTPEGDERTRRIMKFLAPEGGDDLGDLTPSVKRVEEVTNRNLQAIEAGTATVMQGQEGPRVIIDGVEAAQPWMEHAARIEAYNAFRCTSTYLDDWRDAETAKDVLELLIREHEMYQSAQDQAMAEAEAKAQGGEQPASDEAMVAAISQALRINPEQAAQMYADIKQGAAALEGNAA